MWKVFGWVRQQLGGFNNNNSDKVIFHSVSVRTKWKGKIKWKKKQKRKMRQRALFAYSYTKLVDWFGWWMGETDTGQNKWRILVELEQYMKMSFSNACVYVWRTRFHCLCTMGDVYELRIRRTVRVAVCVRYGVYCVCLWCPFAKLSYCEQMKLAVSLQLKR